MDREKVLEIKNLKKYYKLREKLYIKAVDNISFEIYNGETLGLVGQSGSGKSTVGKIIAGIEKANSGEIFFNGKDIKEYKNDRKNLSRNIHFIFQDSNSSLNPRMTIEEIIKEPLKIHSIVKDNEEVLAVMNTVGLGSEFYKRYPSDLSGGQRQKVAIARALILKPKLIIADEPIASLDISMQGQIINLFKKLKKEEGLTILFISHDLTMIEYICDRIMVMKEGVVIEVERKEEFYENPKNPYSKKLINSIFKM
ncbi:MAG: ABC transporter ATP-binding protein [Sarcina sp.]